MFLSQWLIETNTTKRALAIALNVNDSTIYNYINRDRMPRLDIAAKIVIFTNGHVGIKDMIIDTYDTKIYDQPIKPPKPEDML